MKVALAIIAILSNALQDELRFHWFRFFGKVVKKEWLIKWLNPEVSWINKYFKNKFVTFIFSTFLVWTTDAWHFLKFVILNCVFTIFLLLAGSEILVPLIFMNLAWGVLYEFFIGCFGLASDHLSD